MNSTHSLARFWTRPIADTPDLFIVDLFAGGGGASEGIRRATGRCPDVAINHNPAAVDMHTANHPRTKHYCEDLRFVSPPVACGGRVVDLLWASPDCTFHSRARGGKPIRNAGRAVRGLPWVIVRDPIDEDQRGPFRARTVAPLRATRPRRFSRMVAEVDNKGRTKMRPRVLVHTNRHPGWANTVRPRTICLENVPEFALWGPLDADNRPIKARAGETFRRFVGALEALGYTVEWRVREAHRSGAPTSRKRLYLVAQLDGPVVWPEPTHGPGLLPYATAADCLDWSIPCPSILLDRAGAKRLKDATGIQCKRPLAAATIRRVAEGVRRYVVEASQPFVVRIGHQSDDGGKVHDTARPLSTITTKAEHMIVAPVVVCTRNGENKGQRPRVNAADKPLGTITSGGSQGALACGTLVKFYGSANGADVAEPLDTITALHRFGLVTAHVAKHFGGVVGHEVARPIGAITSIDHHSVVESALEDAQLLDSATIGRARQLARMLVDACPALAKHVGAHGMIVCHIEGDEYVLTDVGLRMLVARELATCQGFQPDYVLTGNLRDQVGRIGNSVCPHEAEAIVRANVRPRCVGAAA